MKPSTSNAGKRATAIAVAVIAAIGLTACGGGDKHVYGGFPAEPAPVPAPAPVPVVDSFFAALLKIVANTPDDTEADQSGFDALVATSPDNTEPEPLG
jgi:hypothetical protein